MNNSRQRPSDTPRTATRPEPGQSSTRGTGPRTPNTQK